MKIFVASDHAGVGLKTRILEFLKEKGEDLGPQNTESVDYPDYADRVCFAVTASPENFGVLICGSGQGMSMRANKHKQVRAALCWSEEVAQLSRQHNNANVLCLGARVTDEDLALKIVEVFLATDFEGGRHQRRVDKLSLSTEHKK